MLALDKRKTKYQHLVVKLGALALGGVDDAGVIRDAGQSKILELDCGIAL